MAPPIVFIDTLEDLKKILLIQQLVTRQAKEKLLAVASDAGLVQDPIDLTREPGNDFTKKAATFMADEKAILTSYANNPTLTEFSLVPSLRYGTHWGATFGVTLLVGELILEQVKAMQGMFEPVLRRMFLLLLMEMDKHQYQYLVEPLEKALKFRITKPDGGEVPPEVQKNYTRRLVASLVTDFVVVGAQ